MAIEVGQKLQGKITGISKFGAFVDLGKGKSGLVHISQVASTFVKDINEVVKVGDEVHVKVLSISEDGKIGLSIKDAQDKPTEKKAPQDRKPSLPKAVKEAPKDQSFDNLMSSFLKDSESRLSSLRRNTEGKRGGRGGRRK